VKLRQLFESPRTAVMAFGRMNPPTIGHAKLVDAVKSQGGDPYIFLSQSQKPKTDPLSFQDKLRYAKFFFPEVTIGNPEVKTIIQALQKISELGYENLIYVAGSDRVQAFDELINKYNGKDYNFKSIQVVSAGERDPDADGAEGMSASKMRAAAAAGDLESFKQGVPNQDVADEMYAAVRQGMGVRDEEPVAAEDVSPEDEGKFHNELDDLVHKYFGNSPDEEKMKKKMRKVKESNLVLDKSRLRSHIISLIADKIAATDDIEQLSKWLKLIVGKELTPRGTRYQITSEDVIEACKMGKKKRRSNEDAPPGRERQVKALKKEFPDDEGAPYAIAWAQHNKSGKPKRKSRG
jgi:nicotinic acid mononucleotide adenylyltransferase